MSPIELHLGLGNNLLASHLLTRLANLKARLTYWFEPPGSLSNVLRFIFLQVLSLNILGF